MKVTKTESLKGMFNRLRTKRIRASQYWQLKTSKYQQSSNIANYTSNISINSSLDKVV